VNHEQNQVQHQIEQINVMREKLDEKKAEFSEKEKRLNEALASIEEYRKGQITIGQKNANSRAKSADASMIRAKKPGAAAGGGHGASPPARGGLSPARPSPRPAPAAGAPATARLGLSAKVADALRSRLAAGVCCARA
jgi:hypothetical protein